MPDYTALPLGAERRQEPQGTSSSSAFAGDCVLETGGKTWTYLLGYVAHSQSYQDVSPISRMRTAWMLGKGRVVAAVSVITSECRDAQGSRGS